MVTSFAELIARGSLPRAEVPFYCESWLHGYEASQLCGGAAAYAMCAESGRITALLPMYAVTDGDPLGFVRDRPGRTIVSHGWHCYDTQIVAEAGTQSAFVVDVLEALAEHADTFWLCNAGACTSVTALEATPDEIVEMSPRFRLDLAPFESFDAYLASLSRNLRREIRRHRRHADEAGLRVQVGPVRDADRRGIAMVAASLARRKGTPWYYDADRFTRMLDHLADPARFIAVELRLHGALVGASVVLRTDDALHLWAGGAAHGVEVGFSVGTVLFAAELEHAIDLGVRWVEGGRSNEHYKARFGFEAVPLKGFRWDLQARR